MRTLLVGLVLAVPLAAQADNGMYKLDAARSTLSYKIVHKFHESQGTSHQVQGAAALKGSDALVQVRTDVGSFDSGNANRDAHMKETVEAAKYPEVSLKGMLKGFTPPAKFPGKVNGTLDGQLTFHGQTQPIKIPVEIEFDAANHAHATSQFDISLDGYKVDRPSLMFVKIDDACHIAADLHFVR